MPILFDRLIIASMTIFSWPSVVWIAASFLITQTTGAGTPKLVCPAPEHDFGNVDGSTPVTHTFQISNEGDGDLIIKKVHAPCGCTTYRLDEQSIPAGESLSLPVTLSLLGRLGQTQKSLYLESNDPTAPTLQLTLRGVVGQPLEIKPPVLVLRRDQKSGAVSGEVTLRSSTKARLACKAAKSIDGKTLLTHRALPDGDGFVLRAEAVPSLQPGQHRDTIRLELENNLLVEKVIDAILIIPAEVVAVPGVLKLGADLRNPVSRTILIRGPSGTSLSIESVEVPASEITSRVEKIATDTYRIVLENICTSTSLNGKVVRIRTGGLEPRMLEVPFQLPNPQP